MSSGVFLIKKDGFLVEMQQADYDSEEGLQLLLAQYPNLLAGNLINESNPRKWLLVTREFGVPDKDDSNSRWSIDHLFLDQDGIPTLVEVKRSSDTRIRREVVGQMLEYAANAVQYWDINRLKASYEVRCSEQELEPQETLINELELDGDYDEYWETVKTNLQIGKIRLLFIADEIPLELKQIIEFLNEKMNDVEVLALEIKQYIGQEQKTLIPRIYGQSSKTRLKTGSHKREFWESIFTPIKEGYLLDRRAKISSPSHHWMQLKVGHSKVHFEWLACGRKGNRSMEVALHFEYKIKDDNIFYVNKLRKYEKEFSDLVGEQVYFGETGNKSAKISLSRDFSEPIDEATINWTIDRMKIMYDYFKPKLDELKLK